MTYNANNDEFLDRSQIDNAEDEPETGEATAIFNAEELEEDSTQIVNFNNARISSSNAYVTQDDRPLTEQELNQEDHDIFPDYRVGEKLGRGGCAVVFEGWRKSDNFHVAIKQLALAATLEEDEQRIARKRFYREAKLIASLNEPHIVQCVDYGVLEEQPCMVLEFIKGMELGEYIKMLSATLGMDYLPIEDAVDVTIQVLKALEVSHQKTVIHRDIKPGNIMVLNDDPGGRITIKVLDFGIATVLDNVENNNTLMTQQGNIRGTPSYMAPELFTGAVRASVESDLYAVGLVLLECLTNKVAFEGSSFMQVAYKQVNEEAEIPEYIPECLADIIRKAISKKTHDRYHSARDFITDLENVLPQALKDYPKCAAAYAKSNGKPHKTIAALWRVKKKRIINGIILATIVLALAAIIAAVLVLMSPNDDAEHAAALQRANQENEAIKKREAENLAALEASKAEQAEKDAENEALRKQALAADQLAAQEAKKYSIKTASSSFTDAWIATINKENRAFTSPKAASSSTNKSKQKQTKQSKTRVDQTKDLLKMIAPKK